MTSDWIYYFGYGSLVNRDTRPAGEFSEPAVLKGWRRVWENRTADPARRSHRCTSLSIESLAYPADGSIKGVVARMPVSELAQLDEREAGYDRLKLPVEQFELTDLVETDFVYVYQSELPHRFLADEEHPILQSYIDCVLAGYLTQFGCSGMQDMIDSTRGWDRPVMDDRAAPHYPRAVDIDVSLQLSIDQLLASTKTPDL
ncbi:MAG: cation transport protein ChaC [Granulosicoccus sp.]|jgi:cation transport protein ChaC